MVSFEVTGIEALIAKMAKYASEVPNEAARALMEEVAIEKREAMRRTPVDTGALRASHIQRDPVFRGRDISVTLEVGGPSAPYAWYVHENPDAYHKVGEYKWLERTLLESAPYMLARIARRIDHNRMVA